MLPIFRGTETMEAPNFCTSYPRGIQLVEACSSLVADGLVETRCTAWQSKSKLDSLRFVPRLRRLGELPLWDALRESQTAPIKNVRPGLNVRQYRDGPC